MSDEWMRVIMPKHAFGRTSWPRNTLDCWRRHCTIHYVRVSSGKATVNQWISLKGRLSYSRWQASVNLYYTSKRNIYARNWNCFSGPGRELIGESALQSVWLWTSGITHLDEDEMRLGSLQTIIWRLETLRSIESASILTTITIVELSGDQCASTFSPWFCSDDGVLARWARITEGYSMLYSIWWVKPVDLWPTRERHTERPLDVNTQNKLRRGLGDRESTFEEPACGTPGSEQSFFAVFVGKYMKTSAKPRNHFLTLFVILL